MSAEIDWTERLDSVREDSLGGLVVDGAFQIRAISDAVLRRTGLSRYAALEKSALDLFHRADIGRAAAVIGRAVPNEASEAPGIYRVAASTGTWDIYEMWLRHLGAENDNAVLVEFRTASASARAESLVDDNVDLTQLLVEPLPLRDSFRQIADVAERHVERLCLAITIFDNDGTSTTFCQRDLDPETTDLNAAAHPLSLPPHVVEAYSKAKIRTWRSETEVGTIIPDRPDRMTMVLLDLDDNLLGYVDAFRSSKSAPKEDEWRVYRLVSQTLRAVLLNAQLDTRLNHLGQNDPLTGLTNRHHLLQMMGEAELVDSGVLVINLDGFAWVNSTLGFAAGDTVLMSVAASLQGFVPTSAITARLSGDEFLVWMPKVRSSTEVFRLAEQLRKVIAVPIDNADRRSRTRCSIGATQVLPGEIADDAIHRAVAAMTEAKTRGGDRVSHR